MQKISYNFIILKHIQINSQFRKILMLKVRLSFFGDNLYDYLKSHNKIHILMKSYHPNAWRENSYDLFLDPVVAQWIRPRTLSREVLGSNLLAAAVSALGQGTLSSSPSPLERI